jgi:uncharacterized membrane protein YfcA
MTSGVHQASAGVASRPGRPLGIGFIGGTIGGLLGGGSGAFFVPALEKTTSLNRHSLHGTAGAANIAVTAVGAATFGIVGGSIDLHAGTGLVIGGTLGAAFGAKLILRLPRQLLRWLFVAVLLVTSLKMALDAIGADPVQGAAFVSSSVTANLWFTAPVSLLLGFLIGAWSAGMGLGGGLLAVPVLMLIFGTDLPTAEGTALLMFFPNAIVGTIVHARQGTADMNLATRLNIGAAPGAVAGVLIALTLDAHLLGIVFGLFAFAVAVRELYRMRQDALLSRRSTDPEKNIDHHPLTDSLSSDKLSTEE